jgi:hypothetical protein
MKTFVRVLAVLSLCAALAAVADYRHAANLTPAGTSACYTFAAPLPPSAAVQCSGQNARAAFGKNGVTDGGCTVTAVQGQGLRIIADFPPEPVTLVGNEDTVALISEATDGGVATCTVTAAYPSK